MQSIHRVAACALALVFAAGCASTKVTDRQSEMGGEKLPRPDQIIVHDFTATAAGLPPGSALTGQTVPPDEPMSADQLAAAKQLGQAVANELVKQINAMGLDAVNAEGQSAPQVGDIAIYGAFLSVDQGSGAERVMIGFGKGGADVKTFVEGFLVTAQGMRRLGSGELNAGGSKTPGVGVSLLVTLATHNPIGLVVGGASKAYGEISGSSKAEGAAKRTAEEIAKQLKIKFQQQGWIQSD